MDPTPNTDWVAVISAVGAAIAAVIAAWQGGKRPKEVIVVKEDPEDKNAKS